METQVVIIGGGATGTGIARDLALRGVECIVVDRGDLNSGASGANHGLLHSGARYVARDPVSAWECGEESRLLKRLAPECIEDTGGLFVALPGDDERYIAEFPTLCERCGISALEVDCREAREMEPELSDAIIAAYRVEDASVNPFKLSIDNMAHAEALGARFLDHTQVIGFHLTGKRIAAVHLRRLSDGSEFTLGAEQVVNAAGAWASEIAALAGARLQTVCSKGSLLITHSRLTQRVINRLRPPGDGDIVVPGGSVSLVGTTSVQLEKAEHAHPSFSEVDFLVEEGAEMVPKLSRTRYVRAFAGIRALVACGEETCDREISRGYVVLGHEEEGIENLVSIFGGKLTTYRLMAEKASDLVCRRLGVSSPCLTRDTALPSSEEGRWAEPQLERRRWFRGHDLQDTLLCECEMVPRSAVEQLIDHLNRGGNRASFSAITLRSRVAKGACQGTFCAFRLCGLLYRRGEVSGLEGLDQMKAFLDDRWSGLRPVLWGGQLMQEQLQEAIHCGLFNLEL